MKPRPQWIAVLLSSLWAAGAALAVTTSDNASKAPVSKAQPPALASTLQGASGAGKGRKKQDSQPAAADSAAPKKK